MEETPFVAGFTLTAMSIGWPIASTISGKFGFKIGFRKLSFAGCVSLIAGSSFLSH